jgi:hypothetical protein
MLLIREQQGPERDIASNVEDMTSQIILWER